MSASMTSGYQIGSGSDVKTMYQGTERRICSFVHAYDSLGNRHSIGISLICLLNGCDPVSFLWRKFSDNIF